jgi:hypothetical protein
MHTQKIPSMQWLRRVRQGGAHGWGMVQVMGAMQRLKVPYWRTDPINVRNGMATFDFDTLMAALMPPCL